MLKRIVPLVLALVLCAGLAQAKTKAPATQLPGDLTLAEAQKVLDAALVKAKAQGVPMNIAIVDAGGKVGCGTCVTMKKRIGRGYMNKEQEEKETAEFYG